MEDLNIVADTIDNIHIRYTCPCCKSKYKLNNEPTMRAKPVIHLHGSNNDMSNRIEHRAHHSNKHWANNDYRGVYIHITDETIRIQQ